MQFSSLVFLLGSVALLAATFSTFAQEQAAILPESSAYLSVVKYVRAMHCYWLALRSRVPDELEMQHRYICNLAITREVTALMIDAATDFAASPPGK